MRSGILIKTGGKSYLFTQSGGIISLLRLLQQREPSQLQEEWIPRKEDDYLGSSFLLNSN